MNRRPVIAHVLYRLDTGGMEHLLVGMVNRTRQQYRHAVVCLDGFGALRARIVDPDVPCVALDKKPGKDPACYWRLWKTLRTLRPDLVHTYNFGALDAAPVAKLAGVRRVVHAEHGRDARDPHGESRKYRNMRRWLLPFIDRYVAVSRDLHDWLTDVVGIDASRIVCIPNGLDATRFAVARGARPLLGGFAPPGTILVGTVGRLDPVKDQVGLVSAFRLLCESLPDMRGRLRLAIAGEGPQRPVLEAHIARLGLEGQVCLLGHRDDVPAVLAELDVFALSSIAEGMPGALLEAMAAGLPVVATGVGGVGEAVLPGVTGWLVPARDPAALGKALATYVSDQALRLGHGAAGRERVQTRFSEDGMTAAYVKLYGQLLQATQAGPTATPAVREEH